MKLTVFILWGAVVLCHLLLRFLPSEGRGGKIVSRALLAVLLLLYVAAVFCMMAAQMSPESALACVLGGATFGAALATTDRGGETK